MTRITVEASDVLTLVLALRRTSALLTGAERRAADRLSEAAHAAAAATGEEEQR